MLAAGASQCRTAVPRLGQALCARLTGFVSFLRANEFAVGLDDAALLVDAAQRIGVLDAQLLRWSAQALLCRRAEDRRRFDALFDAWFLPPNRSKLGASRGSGGALERSPGPGLEDAGEGVPAVAAEEGTDEEDPAGGAARRGASRAESVALADFRHLHQPEEMRALDGLMRGLARRLRRLTLRREYAGGSSRIDVQGTVRRSVSHGGEPIELAFAAGGGWRRVWCCCSMSAVR